MSPCKICSAAITAANNMCEGVQCTIVCSVCCAKDGTDGTNYLKSHFKLTQKDLAVLHYSTEERRYHLYLVAEVKVIAKDREQQRQQKAAALTKKRVTQRDKRMRTLQFTEDDVPHKLRKVVLGDYSSAEKMTTITKRNSVVSAYNCMPLAIEIAAFVQQRVSNTVSDLQSVAVTYAVTAVEYAPDATAEQHGTNLLRTAQIISEAMTEGVVNHIAAYVFDPYQYSQTFSKDRDCISELKLISILCSRII